MEFILHLKKSHVILRVFSLAYCLKSKRQVPKLQKITSLLIKKSLVILSSFGYSLLALKTGGKYSESTKKLTYCLLMSYSKAKFSTISSFCIVFMVNISFSKFLIVCKFSFLFLII